LTATRLRVSTPRMRRLLLSVRLPLLLPLTRPLMELLPPRATLQEVQPLLLPLQPTLARPLLLPPHREHIRVVLSEQAGSLATGGTTGVEAGSSSKMEDLEDKVHLSHISSHPELNECTNLVTNE
jgi:hypothetical protein